MPLLKKPINGSPTAPSQDTCTPADHATVANATQPTTRKRQTEMTKDDYWRRREERDVERDKHMAWSGLAQAALTSVSVAQLNIDNTEDGLVGLVARITGKLLKLRDNR